MKIMTSKKQFYKCDKFNALEVPDLSTCLGSLPFAVFSYWNWMVTFSPYPVSESFWSKSFIWHPYMEAALNKNNLIKALPTCRDPCRDPCWTT